MGASARSSPEEFDPVLLYNAFEKMIRDLKDKNSQVPGCSLHSNFCANLQFVF